MRTARVVIRTASVCLLCLGLARATDKLELDETVPLENGAADVKLEAGDIVLTKILVRDAPSEAEVAKANDKYHSYVNPTVVMSNKGRHDADVELELTLQDEEGKEILSCSRSLEVEGKDEDNTYFACKRGRIKTLDWPRVKQAHVVAHIEID